MTTKLPRLNIALNKDIRGALATLAAKRDQSVSAVAADLIESALELQEDFYFSRLSETRDRSGTRRISHADAWK